MDVFAFRDWVVEDNGQFSRSITEIRAQDVSDLVDGIYGAGDYGASPPIELNPRTKVMHLFGKVVASGRYQYPMVDEGIFCLCNEPGWKEKGLVSEKPGDQAVDSVQGMTRPDMSPREPLISAQAETF